MRITHPAHPLRGQAFPVVPHQKQKNPDLTEIELADGERRFIPLAWTDQAPPMVTVSDARFLPAKLLSLRQQLDGLLSLIAEGRTLPPKDSHLEGGSDELPQPVHLVRTDRGATEADHAAAGPNSAAATDDTGGG